MVSSGATRPARAPPSMVMLQTVMRPSMESARIAAPAYSTTWPVPPAVPITPMMARIMSLAVTPGGRSPATVMRMLRGRFWLRVWVASTCSTSLEPMPKARQPKAPCVAVWLSPQTSVAPRQRQPLLGPDDVDDALARVGQRDQGHAEALAVGDQRLDLAAPQRVADAGDAGRAVAGGDRVVGHAQGGVGAANAPPVLGHTLEAGPARHLVDQVLVDIEQRGAVVVLGDHVALPDLVEEGLGAAHRSPPRAMARAFTRRRSRPAPRALGHGPGRGLLRPAVVALLADARCLAAPAAQVVELGAAHRAPLHHLDLRRCAANAAGRPAPPPRRRRSCAR